jgi:hypothetical protein
MGSKKAAKKEEKSPKAEENPGDFWTGHTMGGYQVNREIKRF